MSDYLKGSRYARYGGKDYLDKLYASTDTSAAVEKKKDYLANPFDKEGYIYRCYCTQKFRYYHELKNHRKKAKHFVQTPDVP